MNLGLVTVVTPVYNAERYVEKCINSVLHQTYRFWEQIVVDDGSTDRTAECVAKFNDPRIRYVRLPHRGVKALAETYNTALKASRGPLIAILEGDDCWPPDKLEQQVTGFKDPRVQLTWGNASVIDENDEELWHWPHVALPRRELSMDTLFRRLTRTNILTPAVTVMVRRSALDKIGGFQQLGQALFVDLPTWLMISATSPGIARKLDASLGYYRLHESQVSARHVGEMQSVQGAVVSAVLERLDPSDLRRVGWSARDADAANASARLWKGMAQLQSGGRKECRADLRAALAGCDSAREKLRAGLGLLSAITHSDLVGLADRSRHLGSALLVRLKRR